MFEDTVFLDGLRQQLNWSQERFMAELFLQTVKPGMTVVDVGAFVGAYVLAAAERVGPTGHVYAFEPNPLNFASLVKNIDRAGFSDRVIALPYAITDHAGMQPLFNEGSGSSLGFRRGRAPSQRQVKCATLDSVIQDSVLDVIKMDVEGAEVAALDGMSQTLNRGKPGLVMFVECFPRGLRSAGASPRRLLAALRDLGFAIFLIDERRRRLSPVTIGFKISLHVLAALGEYWVNLFCVRDRTHAARD